MAGTAAATASPWGMIRDSNALLAPGFVPALHAKSPQEFSP
jgi:hypothetical protein